MTSPAQSASPPKEARAFHLAELKLLHAVYGTGSGSTVTKDEVEQIESEFLSFKQTLLSSIQECSNAFGFSIPLNIELNNHFSVYFTIKTGHSEFVIDNCNILNESIYPIIVLLIDDILARKNKSITVGKYVSSNFKKTIESLDAISFIKTNKLLKDKYKVNPIQAPIIYGSGWIEIEDGDAREKFDLAIEATRFRFRPTRLIYRSTNGKSNHNAWRPLIDILDPDLESIEVPGTTSIGWSLSCRGWRRQHLYESLW